MIVFGISYTKDRFAHEVHDAHVALATDGGVYISGPIGSLNIERVEPTKEALAELGARVVAVADGVEREAALATPGGEPCQVLLVSQPGDSAAIPDGATSTWHTIATRFVDMFLSMQGLVGAGVDEFVERAEWAQSTAHTASPSAEHDASHVPGYIPRVIDGVHSDIDILRQARTWRMHLIQSGPPGTGKTTAAQAAHGDELIIAACYDGMTTQDLVGQYLPEPGEAGVFRWVDGPLIEAMQRGRPLLLDDFGWMPPGVQATLLPALDHQRTVTVLDRPKEQTVKAAEGFSVIINVNPGVGFGITGPIRDRAAFELHVPVDLKAAEKLDVPRAFISVAEELHNLAEAESVNGIHRWVPSMRSLLNARNLAVIFDEHFAASALVGECPAGEQRTKLQDLLVTHLELDTDVPEPLQSRSL
ncbi:AAA family ATPase (plasmid) [Rhodococcus pyridinivorans]|uniref:AAA family ATPase n=1 Tax=Rhodococcus pyridinivorans TaxID=103816 RepID=UPI0020C5BA07|nr:AAA family ATPase [Rhodococcus pyridinivorans]UTM40077.1 AAA family ATPase [Rhodococcus pyridinivorans]